uniref:Protein kinase domain-containing protein n=2 Tax=Parascaris univalens TaxID=6257 RepID=A0A915C9E9_PARUN
KKEPKCVDRRRGKLKKCSFVASRRSARQMPIVGLLKKFIRGEEKKSVVKSVPSIVRLETDVAEYWTLKEVIGDGAFGNVYKAVSKSDPTRVAAAKAMELDDDEGAAVMVEVEILTHCVHPNIVQLYDAFTMGNRITLLLEFCGGGAIDSIMVELSRGLTEPQIQCVMREVLKALDFLHQNNVIHRDLKAGNVLLTNDAKVKLADFGVSAFCKDAREERSTFIGTPYWMAPEVMLCETFPEKKYNKLADIWSFGITLIEMAEERPPYSEMNPAKVVFKIIKAEPPTLERPSQWSSSFRDVVFRCLTKDPQNRPTAADLICHPFFAKEGDFACVQRLICEMNAEQVTTEVVGSDLDDDDDTSSSTDVRCSFDTPSVDILELLNGDKESLHSNNGLENGCVIGEADTTPRPSPAQVRENAFPSHAKHAILPPRLPSKSEVLTAELEFTPSVEPALKPLKASSEVNEGANLLEDRSQSRVVAKEDEQGGDSAVLSALTVLDDALKLEDHAQFEVSEEPPTVAPSPTSPHLVAVGDDLAEEEPTPSRPPRSVPSHRIRDIVAETKQPMSVKLSLDVDETNDNRQASLILPVEASPPPCEIREVLREAHFSKPNTSAHATRTFNDEQTLVFGKITLTVGVDADGDFKGVLNERSTPALTTNRGMPAEVLQMDDTHQRRWVNSPANVRRSKRASVDQDSWQGEKSSLHSDSIQDAGKDEGGNESAKEVVRNGDARYVEHVDDQSVESLSDAGGERMQAAFNVLPPMSRELTLADVRRPASFPLSLAAQARTNTRVASMPSPVRSLLSPSALPSNLSKRDRASPTGRVAGLGHDTTPTTSNGVIPCTNDYDYFGTTSSTISSNLQSQVSSGGGNVPHEKDETSFYTAPPPEPPVDYEDERKGIAKTRNQTVNTPKKKNGENVGSRKSPHRQTVTRKTRIYMVDGVQVTSTTHQVFGVKQDYELRKQQLHDLRRLQREEARQLRELYTKAEIQQNEQAKRFALEKENVIKSSELELQALARTQKHQMKDAEDSHAEDMKQTLKRIQYEQEKNLRAFRESLKNEQKQMKAEIDAMPKAQRKDLYRMRKDQLDRDQMRRESEFLERQQSEQELTLRRVQLAHKLKILQLEKKFQQQKHAVLRSREASEWDMEEKQTLERHILYKQELKDRFYLQRTQMLARHQRELEHMRKVNEMNEEEAARSYALYKKRLPKDFRTESKTRIAMFKESLRISCQGEDATIINEKMRAFEEKEKMRVKNAMSDHEIKAARKLKELHEKNLAAIRELEEIHNEKRKMLLEAEQNKLEIYEKEYEQVIADWKAKLPLRKQELEAQFAKELDELDAFYRRDNAELQAITSQPFASQSIF